MNATQQVMIGLDKAYLAKRGGGTIAGFHELHLLDTGAIAFFDEENNMILTTTLAADLAKVQKFYIAQGGADQARTPKVSIPIDRNAMTQWFNTYRAPVLATVRVGKVATVGSWNLPATLLDGMVASVIVINQPSTGYVPNNRKQYTVKVFSTDTVITIGQRLRDAINADVSSIVTATYVTGVNDDYLQVAAKAVGTSFSVGLDDIVVNALLSKNGANGTADNFQGFGTIDRVAAALKEDALTRGASTLTSGGVPYFNYVDILPATGTFDGWTFQWKEEAVRGTNVIQTAVPAVALFLISAGTGNANITTVINLLLQVPGADAGGSGSGLSSGEGTTVGSIPAGGEG